MLQSLWWLEHFFAVGIVYSLMLSAHWVDNGQTLGGQLLM